MQVEVLPADNFEIRKQSGINLDINSHGFSQELIKECYNYEAEFTILSLY